MSRLWNPGDSLTMRLNPDIKVEYLKESSNYASIKYGPVALAAKVDNCGLNADEDFRVAKRTVAGEAIPLLKSPALIGDITKMPLRIKRDADSRKLRFVCDGDVASGPFELIPYNRIHFNRYSLYFPLYSSRSEYETALKNQLPQINELDYIVSNSVDRVKLNVPVSE